MQTSTSLELTCSVRAAPQEVIRAFTHPTLLRDWLCNAASVDARPNGYLALQWADGRQVTGRYTSIQPPESIAFTWLAAGETASADVTVTCRSAEDGATLVSLRYTDRGSGSAWEEAAGRLKAFWTGALENLASVLETGLDLREVRRPRLGIIMEDELKPEAIQRLGLPVTHGVHILDTAEGSGARAAGLQKDDVLVSLNGVALDDPSSFGAALTGLKAGDRPQVEYYRVGQKQAVSLELGTFPVPQVPDTASGLAARVREIYAKVLAAITEQVAGLNDSQAAMRPAAAQRPAEPEWNVKELVMHFILMERDYQSWVAAMLYDRPVEDWLEMRPNQQPRIQAGVERFGSLESLLSELRLAQEETAAMIAAFPESFVRDRKHLYRRAAIWETEYGLGHYFEEHKEQFQTVVDHAKGK